MNASLSESTVLMFKIISVYFSFPSSSLTLETEENFNKNNKAACMHFHSMFMMRRFSFSFYFAGGVHFLLLVLPKRKNVFGTETRD